jgi:hypothetical protein
MPVFESGDRGSNPRGSTALLLAGEPARRERSRMARRDPDTHVAQPVEPAAVNRPNGGSNPSVGAAISQLFAPVVQRPGFPAFNRRMSGSIPTRSINLFQRVA